MYLFRELTDYSYPAIASEFGGRDHTTVMHAQRKVAKLMSESARYTSRSPSSFIRSGRATRSRPRLYGELVPGPCNSGDRGDRQQPTGRQLHCYPRAVHTGQSGQLRLPANGPTIHNPQHLLLQL